MGGNILAHDLNINGSDVIVRLKGSIFSKEATKMREDLIDCLEKGYKNFVFDFSEVIDFDSTGLGVIVTIRKRVLTNGKVVVRNLNPNTKELFERTRLNKILVSL